MTEKTEALRLADALKAATEQTDAEDDVIHVARWFVEDAAAELRRLAAVEAQRDALLEALKRLLAAYSVSHSPEHRQSCWDQARAAIKAVEEEA